MTAASSAPLLRWDGLRLVVNTPLLEAHLARWLARSGRFDRLRLSGAGDAIELAAVVRWQGLRLPIRVELSDLRLRHRRLGFRVRRPRVLGGVRVPRGGVDRLLASFASRRVHVVPGTGIVVVDLTEWIPPAVNLSVVTVQAFGDAIHLWLGPGSFDDLPSPTRRALTAGSPVA